MGVIIIILWGTLSLTAFLQYAHLCKDLSITESFIVALIFSIGGPFFAISNILTAILDCIFPEGWDDD